MGAQVRRLRDKRMSGEDAGGGGRHERADGAPVGERCVAGGDSGPRIVAGAGHLFADVWQTEVVPDSAAVASDAEGPERTLTLVRDLCPPAASRSLRVNGHLKERRSGQIIDHYM